MRIGEELIKYLYLEGARSISVRYEFTPGDFSCLALAPDLALGDEKLAALRRVLRGPLQPELSEYYGSLVGKHVDDSELALAATMAAAELVESDALHGTSILMSRRTRD